MFMSAPVLYLNQKRFDTESTYFRHYFKSYFLVKSLQALARKVKNKRTVWFQITVIKQIGKFRVQTLVELDLNILNIPFVYYVRL